MGDRLSQVKGGNSLWALEGRIVSTRAVGVLGVSVLSFQFFMDASIPIKPVALCEGSESE